MKKLVVDKKFENKKLSVFLLHQFDGLSLNTIYKALRKKDIIVNDVRIKTNVTLHVNDAVTIYIADEFLYKKIEIDVVYEDDNILAINKPIGIEVITSSLDDKSITDLVKEEYPDLGDFPSPCHRLDRNTSRFITICQK